MNKTAQLRELIMSPQLEFIMEAHTALTARIVEEAGFRGIWASGLGMSAAMGVRDNNEASWTQVLEVLEFMSDATTIPVLLDGDTGYGNFNNARRLVKKLEQRQIAGVCIEDKLFPKANSFIRGETQPLADIDEFCGKIKAMKDSQTDDNFVVVSRVEAFIAGWGLTEALRRAEAYRQAGTDAVLIHSKKTHGAEIEAFMREWSGRLPVVIVPTKYYSVPTDIFRELGVSVAIWANHNLRASIAAMKNISKQIYDDQALIHVEEKVVSVEEVFRLQGAKELEEAEKKYLPAYGKEFNAIILAASQGDLHELTEDIPKTLVKVNGKSVLDIQIEHFHRMGIRDIHVVRGFAKEKIVPADIQVIDNDEYARTRELYSLYLAGHEIRGNTIISYGDILFRGYILHDLMNDPNDITLLADADFERQGTDKDFVSTQVPYSKKLFGNPVDFIKMSSDLRIDEIHGEFIGLWKVTEKGAAIVQAALHQLSTHENFKQLSMADLLNHINETYSIKVKYVKGSWLDIDTIRDLQKSGEILC